MFGFIKDLFRKTTPEEERYEVYEYKKFKLWSVINKLKIEKDGSINLETSKYRNELDERLADFIRWFNFNMTKEDILLLSTKHNKIFTLSVILSQEYRHLLPITNNLLKFIAVQNKLDKVKEDF